METFPSYVLVTEHRLGVYENRVARISSPKREEVTGDGRKLHNEELHNLHPSPMCTAVSNRDNEVGGVYSTHGREDK
jgi:hypothetical protein